MSRTNAVRPEAKTATAKAAPAPRAPRDPKESGRPPAPSAEKKTQKKEHNASTSRARAGPNAMDCVDDFNHRIKLLTTDLYQRHKSDSVIWRAKERIFTAVEVSPLFVMDSVGAYLYKYRNEVYAGDEKFFVENSYDTDLKASVVEEKADLTKYIIPKVKDVWKGLTPEERTNYRETVVALLDSYVEYQFLTTVPAKRAT
jgi:hypothetical protein